MYYLIINELFTIGIQDIVASCKLNCSVVGFDDGLTYHLFTYILTRRYLTLDFKIELIIYIVIVCNL